MVLARAARAPIKPAEARRTAVNLTTPVGNGTVLDGGLQNSFDPPRISEIIPGPHCQDFWECGGHAASWSSSSDGVLPSSSQIIRSDLNPRN